MDERMGGGTVGLSNFIDRRSGTIRPWYKKYLDLKRMKKQCALQ